MASHRALPQSYKTAAGWRIPTIGGRVGGQWFRCPEPFDPELPCPNGDHFILVRNYHGSKYECDVRGAPHVGGDYVNNDELDYEAEFYKIAAATAELHKAGSKVSGDGWTDMYDINEGLQSGITSQGQVALLLIFTPEMATMLTQAWSAWLDHECPAALETMMSVQMIQNMLLKGISPLLDPEVTHKDYFKRRGTRRRLALEQEVERQPAHEHPQGDP